MSRTTLGLIAAGVLVGAMFVYLFVAVGSASAVQGTATVSPPPREVSRPKVAVVEPPPTPKVVAKTRSARVPPKPTPPVEARSPSTSTYVPTPSAPRIEAAPPPPPREVYVAPENPNAEERVEMRDESDLAFRENRYEDSLDLALKALETSPQNAVLLRLAVASGCNLGRAEVVEQYSAQLPRAELLKISKGCKRAGYNIIPDDKATATLNPIR